MDYIIKILYYLVLAYTRLNKQFKNTPGNDRLKIVTQTETSKIYFYSFVSFIRIKNYLNRSDNLLSPLSIITYQDLKHQLISNIVLNIFGLEILAIYSVSNYNSKYF
jgi:hypothetical protein